MKNIGVLDEAEIELRDLTIICGENNKGKTYATYAIYGFLKTWRQLLQRIIAPEIKNAIQQENFYEIDLSKMFFGGLETYMLKL
jgi:predicted ATPase